MSHASLETLERGLPAILAAPKDSGVVRKIAIKPAVNERRELYAAQLTRKEGVVGDNWSRQCWKKLPDGSSDPEVQIAVTGARVLELLAGTESRWSLAGDQFYWDLDLSADNLAAGQLLSVGSAQLIVTAQPHNGCKKFAQRYGEDALTFVNSPEGKRLHLRGIYVRVVKDGEVRVGDTVRKI